MAGREFGSGGVTRGGEQRAGAGPRCRARRNAAVLARAPSRGSDAGKRRGRGAVRRCQGAAAARARGGEVRQRRGQAGSSERLRDPA